MFVCKPRPKCSVLVEGGGPCGNPQALSANGRLLCKIHLRAANAASNALLRARRASASHTTHALVAPPQPLPPAPASAFVPSPLFHVSSKCFPGLVEQRSAPLAPAKGLQPAIDDAAGESPTGEEEGRGGLGGGGSQGELEFPQVDAGFDQVCDKNMPACLESMRATQRCKPCTILIVSR